MKNQSIYIVCMYMCVLVCVYLLEVALVTTVGYGMSVGDHIVG